MSKYGQCLSCFEDYERCPDCGLVLCWNCDGADHEQEHRDHERERQARHDEIDREFGRGGGYGGYDW